MVSLIWTERKTKSITCYSKYSLNVCSVKKNLKTAFKRGLELIVNISRSVSFQIKIKTLIYKFIKKKTFQCVRSNFFPIV